MFIPNILDMKTPKSFTRKPPRRPSKIRTRRAKTVPPGPAMGPSMVLAERNIARVVKNNVRANPKCPLGGQQDLLLSSWVSLDPSARYTTVGKGCVEGGGSPPSGEKGGLKGFGSSL